MAKGNLQNTSSVNPKTFDRDLNEDVNDFHQEQGVWTQARNAINNSVTGDLGKLGNESSNAFCAKAPYPIIGVIHINADRWAIFSTDDVNSEIGIFDESACSYTTLVNDPCLNFDRANLIKGVSRATSDCSFKLYWDDGLNPSRVIDIENVPWIQTCTDENGIVLPGPPGYVPVGCITCVDTTQLDCDKIRLAPLIKQPCIKLVKGANGGALPNGSYFVIAAYSIRQQKMTDYYVPSNIQPLFEHDNVAGSLDILVEQMDTDFDEFELVIVSVINQQAVARRVGFYSTRETRITIDNIDARWPVVPVENIPIRTPIVDKTDAMYSVGDYLIRVGTTSKFDFNYQPLANQIVAKWVSVEYPSDYYKKGGTNVGYMRDEVYPFFIRWIYDTGDRSKSYHIPGRPAFAGDTAFVATDALSEEITGGFNYNWVVNNTATLQSILPVTLPDGGVQIAEGYMGYWESTEEYPDKKPDVWNANAAVVPYPGTALADYDLCGKKIRHHRFPDNSLYPGGSSLTNHFNPASNGQTIRIMGVKFENVQPPVDNNGNPITNIVGYEILRGSRDGNRTIIAKGVINNMGLYTPEGGVTNRTGAYVNYPFNDLRPDPFLSKVPTRWVPRLFNPSYEDPNPAQLQDQFSQTLHSFHSPETTFDKPFLSGKELKVHGVFIGNVNGKFEYSEKHPKHKVISNMAFIVSAIAGLGIAQVALNGERRFTERLANRQPVATGGLQTGYTVGQFDLLQPLIIPNLLAGDATSTAVNTATIVSELANWSGGGQLAQNFLGIGPQGYYAILENLNDVASVANYAVNRREKVLEQASGAYDNIPIPLMTLGLSFIPTFSYYWTQGVDSILDLIRAVIRYRDFALKYNSHGFYSGFQAPFIGQRRRDIAQDSYVGSEVVDLASSYRINNQYRAKTVAIDLATPLLPGSALGAPVDNTRQLVTSPVANLFDSLNFMFGDTPTPKYQVVKDPTKSAFQTTSSCYYTSLKQRIRNQYGQIDGILELPIPGCEILKSNTVTPVLFGGDTYVGRYTEKNTFFYFYNWLFDQPDGAELNYQENRMLPHPRFWLNTTKFEASDFVSGTVDSITSNPANLFFPPNWAFPSDFYNLDGIPPGGGTLLQKFNFAVKYAYFYLFNSGVRDFFVESEINIDLRDWGELDSEKHYPLLEPKDLFNTSIIKSGNFYKYDKSLSVSKLFVSKFSWGEVQTRDYDPHLSETCFVYQPNQVIYSLPATLENKRDNWVFYLANNYKNFLSRVTCIKPINKNGAMIFFENESPVQFLGVDQLQTDSGTKLTIGDGGLFSQPLQNIFNADRPYEYGSCQDRLSVINTPMGIYWISQNQGKIFNMQNGSQEISMKDLKWWFASYLPYKLLEQFPNFELTDNPVIGIACQSIYDNENQLVYFTKRDFIVRTDLAPGTTITYVDRDNFLVNNSLPIKLGDPRYFEDASWTVSWDPKNSTWVSWHDWHPNLLIPGKNTFMSILNDHTNPARANGIWVHNSRCDSYCNFYDVDYPFEVEYQVHTVQAVNTLRSIEYIMEVYKYADNCYDRFHVLDFNFDEAVVYNTEQCSGLLKLNLSPKGDPTRILQYPQVNFATIDILYSKEEQKYRFNQFWDITQDRGEFNPIAERVIWNTSANGYVRTLNPNNLNYSKTELQRKKFRHYVTNVLLRRNVSGNRKMLIMITNNKNLSSPR